MASVEAFEQQLSFPFDAELVWRQQKCYLGAKHQCRPFALGRDISNARAEAKAYKQAKLLVGKYVKEMAKTYYNMSLEFEERADYIQRHDAEYVAELSK